VNYHKKKRRIKKKALGRVKKTEKQLLKAMRANSGVRGNLYAVPAVKRALKKHGEALQLDDKSLARSWARREKRHTKRRK
jgi:hypothetical protein